LAWLSLSVLTCGFPALTLAGAQSQQPVIVQSGPAGGEQQSAQQLPGSISGTVVDPSGAVIAGARVTFTRDDRSPGQEALTGGDGEFSFANIAPGPFQLTITAAGFATQTSSGILHAGEINMVPRIAMVVATAVTEVRVVPPQIEAQEEIKEQEKQRVLGVIPNFYVSYVPHAAPLDTKQKFELAWKTSVDPVTFIVTGAAAGLEQADDQYSGYGQGAQGYGKRYGAAYADQVTSTFIGGAILPSLFRQDPRYFYKGIGSTRSRLLYAIANAVICKSDKSRWQANYSYVLGDFAAAGISNLYYPSNDRGAGLTFENAAIGLGATAAANVLQEFIIRKLTPSASRPDPTKP
jgi:Carboxypeptidase regulatory-like domain